MISKTMMKLVVMTTFAVAAAMANPNITAVKVPDGTALEGINSTDKVWDQAKPAEIVLYPQTTIRLNDKKANERNADSKAKIAKVSALYNDNVVAFKISWADDTQSVQSGTMTDEYPDGFAVQFAMRFDDPKKLPYIGMGSDGRPVLIYLQKSVKAHYEPNGNREIGTQLNRHQVNAFGKELEVFDKNVSDIAVYDYQRVFISEGFRSLTELKERIDTFSMEMIYADAGWTGMMSRPLKDEGADFSDAGAIPVAFAVWDGAKLGRDGLKHLSSWVAVDFEGKTGNEDLVKELTAETTGNAEAGKANVEAMCAKCHTLNAEKVAAPYIAPDLSNIGGYSTAAYLDESIKDPSAVIVPGYNRNAHKNFAWYNVDDKGIRTSAMPPMMTDEAVINDAVAYLKTLKAEVEQ
jgi:complex iron-sulfur molybdoenzyme family reductase subunit gamma